MRLTRVLWAVIAIIIAGWIYYIFVSPRLFKPREIEIPNIIGLTEDDAKKELDSQNIKYNIHYVSGKSLCVNSTIPKHGTSIYESYTIDVYVEKPLPVYYQSFVGLMFENNVDMINRFCEEYNLTYRIIYELNNNYNSGQIFYQSKDSSNLVYEGSEIILKVAVSDEYIAMPDFAGRKINDVVKELNEYNLSFNIIYYNAPIDEDIVISQSIEEGTIVKKGNPYSFDIYVSKGMPSELANINVDEFINVLNDLSYNYDIIYVESNCLNYEIIDFEYVDGYILTIAK